MKIILLPIKLILFIAIIAIGTKFWIIINSSFRIDKIQPKDFFNNTFKIKSSKFLDVADIFNQEYRFLSKGRQSFVFISQDKKYVIKFFRFHQYSEPVWSKCFSFFHFFKPYINKNLNEKKDLYIKTMESYKIAFEKLQKETATCYVHLNKTKNLNKKLKIIDKLGKKYVLELDNFGFVVQKRAMPFKDALLKAKNDKKQVNNLLDSFFDNLSSIYKKNILNKDRHLMQNLGVIDDRVIEIDIGRFSKKKFNKNKLEKEVNHYTHYLKKWLSKNISDSSDLLNDKLQIFIEDK